MRDCDYLIFLDLSRSDDIKRKKNIFFIVKECIIVGFVVERIVREYLIRWG